jgi:hypothetical protein
MNNFESWHRENTRKIPIHLFLSSARRRKKETRRRFGTRARSRPTPARARVCRTFNYSPVKNFFFDEREKTKQNKKKTIRKRCFDG